MALPDTLERVGVVVGSALMGMLPVSTLLLAILSDLSTMTAWPVAVAYYLPGVVVGVLVALDYLPVTYEEFWLFCLLSWLLAFGLWVAVAGTVPPDGSRTVSVAIWSVAVALAGLLTWRRAWLLGAMASEPEET